MFRVVELPPNHHICKVKSLNKGDANSEVTVYYQVHTHKHTSAATLTSLTSCVWLFQSICSLSAHLVRPEGLEGAHADGAVGGE